MGRSFASIQTLGWALRHMLAAILNWSQRSCPLFTVMPAKPSASSPSPCLECGLRGGFGFPALEQPCTKICRRPICPRLGWDAGSWAPGPSWVSVRPSLGAFDSLPAVRGKPSFHQLRCPQTADTTPVTLSHQWKSGPDRSYLKHVYCSSQVRREVPPQHAAPPKGANPMA